MGNVGDDRLAGSLSRDGLELLSLLRDWMMVGVVGRGVRVLGVDEAGGGIWLVRVTLSNVERDLLIPTPCDRGGSNGPGYCWYRISVGILIYGWVW